MKPLKYLLALMFCAAGLQAGIVAMELFPTSPSALEEAKKNVVRIASEEGSCSATLINRSFVITAAHCVPQGATVIHTPIGDITLSPPPMRLVNGGAVLEPGNFFRPDGATMRGSLGTVMPIQVDWTKGQVFSVDVAVICGYPQANDQLRCTKAQRIGNKGFFAEFDMVAIPGQSGGGVFTTDGILIGVVSQVTEDGHTLISSVTGLGSREPSLLNTK